MSNSFFIVGAGGHAKVVIEIIEEANGTVVGIADAKFEKTELLGYPVNIEPLAGSLVILAIGNNELRKKLSAEKHAEFGTAIHPRANISSRSRIGNGTVIMAGCTVNSGAEIGLHCIINTNASVDHDCVLGDFVHVSPNASLAGNVTVGEGTHVGIGSSIIQGITIGKWAVIGAGSVIIKDVPDHAVVVGVPGNIIKLNKE